MRSGSRANASETRNEVEGDAQSEKMEYPFLSVDEAHFCWKIVWYRRIVHKYVFINGRGFKLNGMKRLMFTFLIVVIGLSGQAQSTLDSLYSVWQDTDRSDSSRVFAYKEYIWNGYLFSDPDSAIILAETMHRFAEEHDYMIAEYQSYTLQSIAYNILGNFSNSEDYIQKALAGNVAIGYLPGASECHIVIGVNYDEQGLYPQALEQYHKALSIDEKIDNKEGMAMSLNNIGNIYLTQDNLTDALEYYERALLIDEELGVKQGIATELVNIASILTTQGDSTRSREHYERALKLYAEVKDMDGMASVNMRLGNIHFNQRSNEIALEYYEEALAIYKVLGSKTGYATVMTNIGDYYRSRGKLDRAIDFCKKSLALTKEINSLYGQRKACKCLYLAYKKAGNTTKALGYYEDMITLRDSINSDENIRKLTSLQMQYDFDKKEAETKAEQEKKDALAKQELKRQKLVRNSFMGGFAVVFLFAGIFFAQRNRIGKEKKRSDELLLNILPEEVAEELKVKGSADAQMIDEVTVIFTDFKGFTAMSQMVTPRELVADLHACFSEFDRICEKYDIEKIKTIGDAYMAAGGLPTPNKTHAKDVARAALEMAEVVERGKARKQKAGLPFFEIRIGIHTGPVVAGIVGVKKFQYDIWGDTVNTASRMESHGAPGRVNISQSTYDLLSKDPDFVFESRGKIQAKGKGKVEMYFISKS